MNYQTLILHRRKWDVKSPAAAAFAVLNGGKSAVVQKFYFYHIKV